jgi:hypothetical protein
MSCRTTSGGSVSTTLARVVTGLDDKEIQHIFHALKREGAHLPAPSEYDLAAWRSRQNDLLDRARRMSDTRRDDLRNKLFRSRSEPTPNGAMFYAWSRIEGRARQEVAIRAIPEAIDLAPAGSQRDQYELDEHGLPAKIWYASYGSNLHRDRFLTYIKGGSPEGSTRWYDGCRDQSIPDEDIAIRIPGARPHFALTSRVWRGGIAFIDAAKGETATGLGRAYMVNRDQFEDVVAQENGFRAGQCNEIPYADVLDTSRVVTGTGPYETMLHIGDHEGAPVLTFTSPFSTRDALGRKGDITRKPAGDTAGDKTPVRMPVLTNKPSAAYMRMIGSGLAETFGMDEVAQADYLRGCPGGDRYDRAELVRILRTRPAPAASRDNRSTSWNPYSDSNAALRSEVGAGAGAGRKVPEWTKSGWKAGSTTNRNSEASGSTSTAHSTRTRAPLVEATRPDPIPVDPTQRAIFPAVKTYASGEDKAKGLTRWNAELRGTREDRDYYKRQLEIAQSLAGDDPERLSSVADMQHRYNDLCLRVDELNAKVRYAKSQQPEKWYAETERPRSDLFWTGEANKMAREVTLQQGKLREAERTMAWLIERNGTATQISYQQGLRTKANRNIERFQSRYDECMDRLAEFADGK